MPLADVSVVQDQGVLISGDIVAVEMATLDMIGKAPYLPGSKGEEYSSKEGHVLQNVTGKDPYAHVRAAAELGMGQMNYEFVEIERKSGSWDSPYNLNTEDSIPLKPKGHGWHRESSDNPHPCQSRK
jgi:hypothetical protein